MALGKHVVDIEALTLAAARREILSIATLLCFAWCRQAAPCPPSPRSALGSSGHMWP